MFKEVEDLENIGQILKEKRLELNYTLEDMSQKTKMSTVQLKAIVDGNISFFKEDLSYLSYFVRYYSNALNIDYNELRKDLDHTITEFTQTISIKEISELEAINQKIDTNAKKKDITMDSSTNLSKVRRSIDYTSWLLLGFAVIITIGLIFSFFKFIVPALKNTDPIDKPIVTPLPKPDEGETPAKPNPSEPKPEPEKPNETATTISKVDASHYSVQSWNENETMMFEYKISVGTTIRFNLDGVAQSTPEPRIYKGGETVSFTTTAAQARELRINVGYPLNNEIYLNGEKVDLDASITNSTKPALILFSFDGGN